ncbi:hypothetical protein [Actinoplanes sp. NPDC051859]|uniref:hypothetical protein n=1 Tax=Actinoplanes sp. NPDC051859 TaxID=3363909 RepID=UPI003790302C
MNRVVWIQARRSTAPIAFLLLLALGLVSLFVIVPDAWQEAWLYLATNQRAFLLLSWPIALALGAWQMRRESLAKVDELFAATARPRWQRVTLTGVVLAAAVAVAYLLTFGVAAVSMLGTAAYLPAAVPVMVAVGALSLAAAVWVGMGIGYLIPHVVTAPGLAVVGFALQLGLELVPDSYAWLGRMLAPQLPRPWDPYYTVPVELNASQAIWLTGLGLTGLLLAATTRRYRPTALVPVLLGACLAVVIVPTTTSGSGPWVRDFAGARLVCTQDTPRVCVTLLHKKQLDEMTLPAREALARVAGLPDAPTEAVEDWTLTYGDSRDVPGSHQRPGLEFIVDIEGAARSDSADFLLRTLTGYFRRTCLGTTQENYDQDSDAARASGHWLAGRTPHADTERVHQLWNTLQALPREQAVKRLAAVRNARQQCDTALSDIILGGAK